MWRAPDRARRTSTLDLTPGRALALGVLHGPAELFPVSSSAHMTLLPWLAGWGCQGTDGRASKSFEVAVHGGVAGALLVGLVRDRSELGRLRRGRRPLVIALACTPPALAGLLLQRRIERLGSPRQIAAGLAAGAAAMVVADRRGAGGRGRPASDAGFADALALGAAQAVALVPGVSRSGATLATARVLGFDRAAATELSGDVGLPVLVGAAGLRTLELVRDGAPAGLAPVLAAGATGALAATLALGDASARARRGWPLAPFAAYRLALAALVIRRLGQNRVMHGGATLGRVGKSG